MVAKVRFAVENLHSSSRRKARCAHIFLESSCSEKNSSLGSHSTGATKHGASDELLVRHKQTPALDRDSDSDPAYQPAPARLTVMVQAASESAAAAGALAIY